MSINTQFGDLISPTFTPSGRGGLREFLLGTPEQFVRTPSSDCELLSMLPTCCGTARERIWGLWNMLGRVEHVETRGHMLMI